MAETWAKREPCAGLPAEADSRGGLASPLEQLRSLIRQQVAQRRASLPSDNATGQPLAPLDWCTIVASLHQAEHFVDFGYRPIPPPGSLPGPLRFLARGFARLGRLVLRNLLSDQREFNRAVLACARTLQVGLYQSEQNVRQLRQELAQLRQAAGANELPTDQPMVEGSASAMARR